MFQGLLLANKLVRGESISIFASLFKLVERMFDQNLEVVASALGCENEPNYRSSKQSFEDFMYTHEYGGSRMDLTRLCLNRPCLF